MKIGEKRKLTIAPELACEYFLFFSFFLAFALFPSHLGSSVFILASGTSKANFGTSQTALAALVVSSLLMRLSSSRPSSSASGASPRASKG